LKKLIEQELYANFKAGSMALGAVCYRLS